MDAANLLKPALARGQLQVIGATTIAEYRKHIEKDAALERRLQPVMVKEPSVEETTEILRAISSSYEQHHKVKYTYERTMFVHHVLRKGELSNALSTHPIAIWFSSNLLTSGVDPTEKGSRRV